MTPLAARAGAYHLAWLGYHDAVEVDPKALDDEDVLALEEAVDVLEFPLAPEGQGPGYAGPDAFAEAAVRLLWLAVTDAQDEGREAFARSLEGAIRVIESAALRSP